MRKSEDQTVADSISVSSSQTDSLRRRRQPRVALCPPLVVAPAHGTLQLVPLRHATPTSSHEQASSASSSSSREMLSSNASVISDAVRRPVQITADPRISKGSVFANRRLANDRVSSFRIDPSHIPIPGSPSRADRVEGEALQSRSDSRSAQRPSATCPHPVRHSESSKRTHFVARFDPQDVSCVACKFIESRHATSVSAAASGQHFMTKKSETRLRIGKRKRGGEQVLLVDDADSLMSPEMKKKHLVVMELSVAVSKHRTHLHKLGRLEQM